MTKRPTVVPFVVFALTAVLGLAGCGVGATDRPVDVGDPAAGAPGPDSPVRELPGPDEATSVVDEVRNFLKVAAGERSVANERMKAYLTSNELARWQDPLPKDNPPLSVVRIVGGPQAGNAVGVRTPVTLSYQVIGTMTDQGRIDDLASLATMSMTFWVVPGPDLFKLRIDEIQDWPGGLLLSDDGLRTYYQIQPIYFWDQEYRLLVPDLRYVPVTLTADKQADKILSWLEAGPSPWISSGAQRLPAGTTHELPVTQPDETLRVRLTAAAADPEDPQALRRLMYQLRWSLSWLSGGDASPRIELWLDDQKVSVDAAEADFRSANHSRSYDAEPVRYDITTDGVVVSTAGTPSPTLDLPENSNVEWAAIERSGERAAFVRRQQGSRRYLEIVRSGADPLRTQVPVSTTLGRPSFVPDTDVVLVPTGGSTGQLLAVSAVDGSYEVVSQGPTGLTGVTAATVSPDGRRVAVVADGDLYVSSLVVTSNGVKVGSFQRQLLAERLEVRAVAWTSESWLLVAGTSGSSPALWRVGADGVLAEDLSGNLLGLGVQDLVSYPRWHGSPRWDTPSTWEVLAVTSSGVYAVRNRLGQDTGVKPFFGT